MKNRMTELYRSLAKHFSQLCSLPVTVVDSADRSILLTHKADAVYFCDRCPNRCRLLQTMLYGCNEARRWNGRYIFYCPIGLVFSAVTVPETDQTVVAGPLITGEVQDTIFDLPDYIDPESVLPLFHCSADTLNHISSILEMAVYGLRYRPEPSAYDRNVIPGEDEPEDEDLYTGFPLAGTLKEAVRSGSKAQTQDALNHLLRYVYAPHPDQLALIKSRAVQLVRLLAKEAPDQSEEALYLESYIPALKKTGVLEEMDIIMTELLHHFVDYTFDFSQIRHADTVYHIMEFIKSNYEKKIGLEEVAAYVHLSSSHVGSLFRKKTGQTVSEYLNQVRIEKSKTLLAWSDMPIFDVAYLCGFGDQSYFTHVFKKQTGLSPKKFRQQAQQTDADQ